MRLLQVQGHDVWHLLTKAWQPPLPVTEALSKTAIALTTDSTGRTPGNRTKGRGLPSLGLGPGFSQAETEPWAQRAKPSLAQCGKA